MLFFMLINVKMLTIVGILTFMSRKNFMLNSVEHERSFIIMGPGHLVESSTEFSHSGQCKGDYDKLLRFGENLATSDTKTDIM